MGKLSIPRKKRKKGPREGGGGRTVGETLEFLAPLLERVEIVEGELVPEDTDRCQFAWGNSGRRSTDELSTICRVQAISMLRACAAFNMSMSGTPSPDVTELRTNSAQAAM